MGIRASLCYEISRPDGSPLREGIGKTLMKTPLIGEHVAIELVRP
jgi:hypothetical protein